MEDDGHDVVVQLGWQKRWFVEPVGTEPLLEGVGGEELHVALGGVTPLHEGDGWGLQVVLGPRLGGVGEALLERVG